LAGGIPTYVIYSILYSILRTRSGSIYVCVDLIRQWKEEMSLYDMLEEGNAGDESGLVDLDETNEDLLMN